MPEGIRKVNVIGHLHPDTDSVCSAIAYAHLKNEVEHTDIYQPRRAGAINRETAFVLRHFGFAEPELITSVTPQIKDTEIQRQGGIHGREYIGAYLVCCQLEHVLELGVPEDVRFHFIPMTNPDGVEISRTRTLGEAQLGIYRQQLAAGLTELSEPEYAAQWKANAAGVDLNRNFDAGWAQIDGGAAPASEGFKGAAPEDQPESRALAEYTRSVMPDATLSYHSSGSLIYADYAGAPAEVNAASRSLGAALGAAAGYPLAETESLDEGGFKDWAASALGIPSVTVELGYGEDPQRLGACAVVRQRNEEAPYVAADWLRQYGAG